MANKYHTIQQLISFWDEFEALNTDAGLTAFAGWLKDLLEKKKGGDKDIYSRGEGNTAPENQVETEVDNKHKFISLISRLARLQDFYTKKLFEGLPLSNLLEFNFLMHINKNMSLKKKEIIDYNLVEYTTGIDIIKRLIRLGLVDEFQDQLDRRSKRLKITSEGKKVLVEALITLKKIEHLFFLSPDLDDWETCIPVLETLEAYHSGIFAKSDYGSGYKILQVFETASRKTEL